MPSADLPLLQICSQALEQVILTLSCPKSCWLRHLVKNYTNTNNDARQILLLDRYVLLTIEGDKTPFHLNYVACFSRCSCSLVVNDIAMRRNIHESYTAVREATHLARPEIQSTIRPSSIPLVPPRVLRPARDSLRADSLRRRVHGHLNCCPSGS